MPWWMRNDNRGHSVKYERKLTLTGVKVKGERTVCWDWGKPSHNARILNHRLLRIFNFLFSWLDSPTGSRPPHCRGFTISLRHTTIVRSPLDEWSDCRRDLYLKTHSIRKRDNLSPGGIRTRNPSKREAAARRLRPRRHLEESSVRFRKHPHIAMDAIYKFIPQDRRN